MSGSERVNNNNALLHAVSLGNFETSSSSSSMKRPTLDRNYDSEDENISKHRLLNKTQSSELYTKPSQYSKGDIREQYCLSDRQISTINERSRSERFFGCLSRRTAPQSILGGCVGRRIPSDENLAPFYRYPRYPHQHQSFGTNDVFDSLDPDFHKMYSSYFRRQPATILTTSSRTTSIDTVTENRHSWSEIQQNHYHNNNNNNNDNLNYFNKNSLHHYPSEISNVILSTTPVTKHVSFARSHTLTSIDDLNVNVRSSKHMNRLSQNQERLIGGKKTFGLINPCCDALITYRPFIPTAAIPVRQSVAMLQQGQEQGQGPIYQQNHNYHHHHQYELHHNFHQQKFRSLGHIQQFTAPCGPEQIIQKKQPISSLTHSLIWPHDNTSINSEHSNTNLTSYSAQNVSLPSPEVIVIEKKFRNAMKTQATQTTIPRHVFQKSLALSPRTIHRVKVVSQGAQTNSFQNDNKNLIKSLSQITCGTNSQLSLNNHHETIHRSHSEEPNHLSLDQDINFSYYKPPPPPDEYATKVCESFQPIKRKHTNGSKEEVFFYESNSLPRRTCGHRLDTEFHSLPRTNLQNFQDVCKHITECSELIIADVPNDFEIDLLPPPQEYCRDEKDSITNDKNKYPKYRKEISDFEYIGIKNNVPFNRGDIRRQSMPIYTKVEYHKSTKTMGKFNRKSFRDDMSDENEIIINFEPAYSEDKLFFKNDRTINEKSYLDIKHTSNNNKCQIVDTTNLDPVYENVKNYIENIPSMVDELSQLDDKGTGRTEPCSPIREQPIDHVSVYLSSDSLANDNTRDHSDAHWNESEVTVLTVDNRSDIICDSNLLLTPSSRRKKLLLQHQQRSSIDTDVLDLEEIFTDQSPTLSHNVSMIVQPRNSLPINSNMLLTSMEELQETSKKSTSSQFQQRRSSENSLSCPLKQQNSIVADISECSTNTEEYTTCTDTSRRTKTNLTNVTLETNTTSSSSITQIPVSTQSSQIDPTPGESSFESASSLYSSRGEYLADDLNMESTERNESQLNLSLTSEDKLHKKSSTHSLSSISTGSYNAVEDDEGATEHSALAERSTTTTSSLLLIRKFFQTKTDLSDDERSEMHYSSSGYYESPHDDEYHRMKSRRFRSEEERNRRKISIKIELQKENNLESSSISQDKNQMKLSPERQRDLVEHDISPINLKRYRPKIRRQLRRTFREESNNLKQQRKTSTILSSIRLQTEPFTNSKLLCQQQNKISDKKKQPKALYLSSLYTEISSETMAQLKSKSIESLNRSISPGSDSVFYSEADGNNNANQINEQSSHDNSKNIEIEVDELEPIILCSDSVESIPYINNEFDIVKPPSDFADSPITNITPQRLYKKWDKRLRSEDRYSCDRSRIYKCRKETIRAKSEERTLESCKKTTKNLRPTGSSPCILPEISSENKQQTIYIGHYHSSRYVRLADSDIWAQLDHRTLERKRDRHNSTESEKSFCTKYQVILHRLVQRRCTLEMYHRQKNEVFGIDKSVVVNSNSGEFGFRIHGSKPVVVAAIEPDTPAESSGLEVGDIIISVNGIPVLDKHHTEVVKIAHDGCERLELQVACTLRVLINEQQEPPVQIIFSGFLWRQSGNSKSITNIKKWIQRWFVLRSDNCLYYYKTAQDNQPVGAMIITKHKIEMCSTKIGRINAFKIDSDIAYRPMYLAADTKDLAQRWIGVLKKAALKENNWIDKKARNLYKTPDSIKGPDCFGYLMKLVSKWSGWSKRYCVLQDACLYFYQDVNSKTALGMVCLHGYKVASMPSGSSGKKYSFEVTPPITKLRHYYFYAESDIEKKRWISALEYSIDRWIKSG